jgi:glutamyl-tRNA synthetase
MVLKVKTMTTRYNTRFAPSPTGDMHLGNLRTAYFNWLAARSTGGTFTLRIDDTDADRNTDSAVDTILDILDWVGLDFDRMIRQSDRGDVYRDAVGVLDGLKLVNRSDGAARISVDADVGDSFNDMVNGTCKVTDRRTLSDLVILRSDGTPTYHFASTVDDTDPDLGINLVIRGSDHLANTPRHIGIAAALGSTYPTTAHVGLIHYKKRKLSKRDGVGSVLALRDSGVDPRALLNYINRLGWAPTVDNGRDAWMLPRDRALALFWDGGSMKAKSSNFDDAQFDWLCRRWKAIDNG